jgi:hypothetical protein
MAAGDTGSHSVMLRSASLGEGNAEVLNLHVDHGLIPYLTLR